MQRILVVDDEKSICKALETGLSSNWWATVDTACSGHSALLLGYQHTYDVIIADLHLPDMTGIDVIRSLKQVSRDIIPFIITGHGCYESSREAIQLNVRHYFEKPLNFESLELAVIREINEVNLKQKLLKKKIQNIFIGHSGAFSELPTLLPQIASSLMSIIGNAEIAQLKLEESNANDLKRHLSEIIENSKKIINKINRCHRQTASMAPSTHSARILMAHKNDSNPNNLTDPLHPTQIRRSI